MSSQLPDPPCSLGWRHAQVLNFWILQSQIQAEHRFHQSGQIQERQQHWKQLWLEDLG